MTALTWLLTDASLTVLAASFVGALGLMAYWSIFGERE